MSIILSDPAQTARLWAINEIQRNAARNETWGVHIFCKPEKLEARLVGQPARHYPGWYIILYTQTPQGHPYHYVPVGAPVPDEAKVRAAVKEGMVGLRDLVAQQNGAKS